MGVDPAGWDRIGYHIALLATAVPQTLLVVYVAQLRTPGVAARLGWRRPRWSEALSGLLAIVVLFGVLAVVSLVTFLVAGTTSLEPVVKWQFTRMALLPLVAVSSVAVGYREEIFYRAYLIVRGEEAGVNPLVIVGTSSVVFAAGHLYQGIPGFVVALVVGVVFSWVFYYRRSLHGIAIAHGIYNTAVLLQSAFGTSQ
jgi:membrane protease YdiL (CAAX protease family)